MLLFSSTKAIWMVLFQFIQKICTSVCFLHLSLNLNKLISLLCWSTPVQLPTPAELKYNWPPLFHFKTSMWLILSSDCQDIITTVIFSHHYLVIQIANICTFSYASDDRSIFRVDGTEEQSRSHLQHPGAASCLVLIWVCAYTGWRARKSHDGHWGANRSLEMDL